MTDILEKIKAYKLIEVEKAQTETPLTALEKQIASRAIMGRPFEAALRKKKSEGQYGIIAEIKKASPSKGIIREDFSPPALARAYAEGGATCLSVLTDKPSFQGDDTYLEAARNICDLPCLRKDFMFTPYQIIQSKAIGADCILLIMACLEDAQAKELETIAQDLQMDVLIEIHDTSELDRALNKLSSKMIGINNRNLKNFVTDLSVSEELSRHIPNDYLIICESGLNVKSDLDRMADHGMTSFLIGESLMRQEDVTQALRQLLF
ncbi:MAG: indole-3-glycerol phosphate synthase TrpC [Pseudomonadota bacterium]